MDSAAPVETLTSDVLTALARRALTSADPQEREEATSRLRYLSSYEQWPNICAMIKETTDVHFAFLLVKAMKFIVSNEIGPEERTEVQQFALRVAAHRSSQLPAYVIKGLFGVYAAALYLNWRMMLISQEDQSAGTEGGPASSSSSMGEQIQVTMSSILTSPLSVLECMLEVVQSFAREDEKSSLSLVRQSFVNSVLPYFLSYAEAQMNEYVTPALTLALGIIDCVPHSSTNAPLVSIVCTSDDSIFVTPAVLWLPPLSRLVARCRAVVDAGAPTLLHLQFVRLASTVMMNDWNSVSNLRSEIETFGFDLLHMSTALLFGAMQTSNEEQSDEMLKTGVSVLVNCFERDELMVGSFLFSHLEIVGSWADAAIHLQNRWTDSDSEVRKQMMHLFYLLGTRSIPPTTAHDTETGDDLRRGHLTSLIHKVFDGYLSRVMTQAHLVEDSTELRAAEGVVLHSEEYLQPIAEMVFCEALDFASALANELQRLMQQYEQCIRLGRGDRIEEESLLSLMTTSLDSVSLAGAAASSVASDDTVLLLRNVILSRMSVLVTVVGMVYQSGTVTLDHPMFEAVTSFLTKLVEPEEDIMDSLLHCLRFDFGSDSPPTKKAGASPPTGSHPGVGAGSSSSVHVGILRALFFFCRCGWETDVERQSIVPHTVRLISFVLLKHSDCCPLVSDAVRLLQTFLTPPKVSSTLLSSERFLITLNDVLEGKVTLLQPLIPLSAEQQQCREELLGTLVWYMESRALHQRDTSVLSLLSRLFSICTPSLSVHPARSYRDLAAMTSRVQSTAALLPAIEFVVEHGEHITAACRNPMFRDAQKDLIRLWSILTEHCRQFWVEDLVSTTPYEFASLVFNSMQHYFETLLVPTVQQTGELDFAFAPNVVSEAIMYDICTVILSTCGSSWCNLGVMIFYNDDAVEQVMLSAVELLTTVPVELIVSREDKRHRVFHAIQDALTFSYSTKRRASQPFVSVVWPQILVYLVQCLAYRFSHLALNCIFEIMQQLSSVNPALVPASCVPRVVQEVAVGISTTTLAEETVTLGFQVMQLCCQLDQGRCEDVLERLLSFSSAYHRVRLRCILMMLRNKNSPNPSKSYTSIFGTTSKVATLHAW